MPTVEEARNWYPDDDPVHGFEHVMRVYQMAERLAIAEGADLEIIQSAALLHDAQEEGNHAQQSVDHRNIHHLTSAELAGEILRAEGWETPRIEAVQHCIRAHRFRDGREPPQTLEAKVLFDADKLDAIGAIGAARAIAFAAQAGQLAYAQPSQRFMETGQTEPGEPHSAYHEFVFKLRKLKDRLYTPAARQIGEERHRYLEEFFIQLAGEITGQR
jgi:uncharacterized protein